MKNARVDENGKLKPIQIQEQGSFAVGGTVISNPGTLVVNHL